MSRLENLFSTKKNILSVYVTAGYPKLDDTISICTSLEKAGADMIEIGIPFSDPVADGPVIQRASELALKNGVSLKTIFNQLTTLRKNVSIPCVLMGYFNPILQYGVDTFITKCKELGIDGVIIPDLPLEEYKRVYRATFEKAKLDCALFISPTTTDERMKEVDSLTSGFIYAVSSPAVTGNPLTIDTARENYFKKLKSFGFKHPVLIGFGISSGQAFKKACSYSAGAIVGSAFISHLERLGEDEKAISQFVDEIRQSL